ncbi:MAG: Asp-tRNA(Asn)/Glu-tRNA(Gln) amidotransferase subunit GatA, partial [Phycisphaerales bacterium]
MKSAREQVAEALARIEERNGACNAFVEVYAEEATARAAAIDERVAGGEDLPLAGMPIAVKDNICTKVGKTTCASRILEGYRSPFDATVIGRLEAAGAVIVGKTNMDEFGMGSGTEHSVYGPTKNPWDTTRVAGGSSGGSAAAVAAGMVPVALGSDTGGSIRQPAGMCGVVGLKPTYGRVSRYGLVAFASSLDQIGPLTRTVEEAARVLGVIAGEDPNDATSSTRPVHDLVASARETPMRLRVGVVRAWATAKNDPGVDGAMERAKEVFRVMGAELVDVDLPHAEHAVSAYYIVAPAEASSNLARFDGVRYGRRAELDAGEGLEALYLRSRSEGFGAEVQRRIMLGTYALSSGYYEAYYNTALKVRRRIKEDYDAALGTGERGEGARCDVLLMPTSPTPAYEIGCKRDDPVSEYLEDIYTVGVNLAGLPAISLPAGFGARGLPIG